MLNIEPYTDVTFINAFIFLYTMYCREYRLACEQKDEACIKIYGDACNAFEDLAEVLGIDMDVRIPFERDPECCASCKHWDAAEHPDKVSLNIAWDEMSDEDQRSMAFGGNCVKICESVGPDQQCNYEMMNTENTFYCNKYEKWNNLK